MGRADKEAHAYLFYPDKSLLSDQARVCLFVCFFANLTGICLYVEVLISIISSYFSCFTSENKFCGLHLET